LKSNLTTEKIFWRFEGSTKGILISAIEILSCAAPYRGNILPPIMNFNLDEELSEFFFEPVGGEVE